MKHGFSTVNHLVVGGMRIENGAINFPAKYRPPGPNSYYPARGGAREAFGISISSPFCSQLQKKRPFHALDSLHTIYFTIYLHPSFIFLWTQDGVVNIENVRVLDIINSPVPNGNK